MHSLSIAQVLGYLGWCFCGYAAWLLGYSIWKRRRPLHAQDLDALADKIERLEGARESTVR